MLTFRNLSMQWKLWMNMLASRAALAAHLHGVRAL